MSSDFLHRVWTRAETRRYAKLKARFVTSVVRIRSPVAEDTALLAMFLPLSDNYSRKAKALFSNG